MELIPIDRDNLRAVVELAVRDDQKAFVASNAISLAQAYVHGDEAWPRACYDGESLVGFVMLGRFANEPPYLWRLMVGAAFQRQGLGREIVQELARVLRAEGCTQLVTSYVPGPGSPEPFYEALGFLPTGELDEGERVVVLAL